MDVCALTLYSACAMPVPLTGSQHAGIRCCIKSIRHGPEKGGSERERATETEHERSCDVTIHQRHPCSTAYDDNDSDNCILVLFLSQSWMCTCRSTSSTVWWRPERLKQKIKNTEKPSPQTIAKQLMCGHETHIHFHYADCVRCQTCVLAQNSTQSQIPCPECNYEVRRTRCVGTLHA